MRPPLPPLLPADEANFDISLWTSAFVLLTLLVNAPLIGPVMRWTGLSKASAIKKSNNLVLGWRLCVQWASPFATCLLPLASRCPRLAIT